jgi:hypothetical protein
VYYISPAGLPKKPFLGKMAWERWVFSLFFSEQATQNLIGQLIFDCMARIGAFKLMGS